MPTHPTTQKNQAMTDNHFIGKTELLGTAAIGAAKAEEGHPRHYRLGRRNGELVLQGAFFWQRGFRVRP